VRHAEFFFVPEAPPVCRALRATPFAAKSNFLVTEKDSLAAPGSSAKTPRAMIELFQVPWSPYCLVQRRILEFSGAPFKLVNVSAADRSLIWKLTRQRYYQVPILRDGRNVVFETDDNSQVLAKYLNERLGLNLFPHDWDGIQDLLWRYIDNDVEAITFKLNDAYFEEFVPRAEQLGYRRHKERKFGRHCLEQWREGENSLRMELEARLVPFEQMLAHREFLLDAQPRFVDFDLWGILANALYTGHHSLPAAHTRLGEWYGRMSKIKSPAANGQKRRRK
jgi:glutathione S-transferase